MKLAGWLKEPLVHFLIAGGLLFVAGNWIAPPPADEQVITIDRAALRDHLQARTQVYDEARFDELLAAMSEEERGEIAREAAITEALWREGSALRLAENDPLVRERVIQQMRQLLLEEAASEVVIGDEAAEAFYKANQARYASAETVSFTHHFFRDGAGDGEARARAALAQLRSASSNQEPAPGDRFLYQRSYGEAGKDEIASQFGDEFAAALFAAQPGGWIGPLRSQHGWHVVNLRQRQPGTIIPLPQIRERVREDAAAEARAQAMAKVLDGLMARYEVKLASDIVP